MNVKYCKYFFTVLLSMFVSKGYAVDEQTLILAHNLDESHVVAQSLVHMSKGINEKSDGKMKLEILPANEKGGPRETLQLLQTGKLDFTKASASELEPFSPAFSVFSLPYLFKSKKQFENVIYGDIGSEIMQQTKDNGFVAIAVYQAGTRSFYSKHEIHTPSDMKGLKVRIVPTPTTLRLIELLGAIPAPIPFSDVYNALASNVIDAAENNEPSYVQKKHVEIAKFYTEDQHTSVPDYLVVSLKTWNKLSDEQKNIIMDAAKNSEKFEVGLWDAQVKQSRADAIALGAKFIEVDKNAFRDVLQPLYTEFMKDPVRAKWLNKINSVSSD